MWILVLITLYRGVDVMPIPGYATVEACERVARAYVAEMRDTFITGGNASALCIEGPKNVPDSN